MFDALGQMVQSKKMSTEDFQVFNSALQRLSDDPPQQPALTNYMKNMPGSFILELLVVELGEVADEQTIKRLQEKYEDAFPPQIDRKHWEQALERARERTAK